MESGSLVLTKALSITLGSSDRHFLSSAVDLPFPLCLSSISDTSASNVHSSSGEIVRDAPERRGLRFLPSRLVVSLEGLARVDGGPAKSLELDPAVARPLGLTVEQSRLACWIVREDLLDAGVKSGDWPGNLEGADCSNEPLTFMLASCSVSEDFGSFLCKLMIS